MNSDRRSPVSLIKVLGLLLLVNGACSEPIEFDAYYDDPERQQKLIVKLREAGVEFRLDDNNVVWYRARDHEKVKNIRNKILHDLLAAVGKHAIYYPVPEERQLFIDALEREGIKYELKKGEYGRIYVSWLAEDEEQVKHIQDVTGDLILKKRAKARRKLPKKPCDQK